MHNPFYRRKIARVCATALALLALANQTALAAGIGDAQVVVNDVRGTIGTNETVLRAGIDVLQNEVINTGQKSASRVLFQDNTTLAIGPSSQVKLDRFVYDPDPTKSAVALSIARGVVRFTTGGLPKSAYQINTPTATIGVRGTIITITVADDGTTTISVIEGVAVVTAGGQTVTVDAGNTTTVSPGTAPTAPFATASVPPPPVGEMDYLLADNTLPPGGPAGRAATNGIPFPIEVAGFAVILGGAIGIIVSGGGHNGTSTSTTGTNP